MERERMHSLSPQSKDCQACTEPENSPWKKNPSAEHEERARETRALRVEHA